MWKVVQELLPAVLVILFISQLVIPLVFNCRTWWLFRGEKEKESTNTKSSGTLADELNSTKAVVDEAKAKVEEVKTKVDGNLKSAEDLKKEADKLL